MLDRIHWLAVVVGSVATILLAFLLTMLIFTVVDPFLYDLFAIENSEERVAFTGRGWSAYTNLSLLLHLLAVLLAFFSGGTVAGRVGSSSPRLNGVMVALVAIGVGLIWMLVTFLPVLLSTLSESGNAHTRAENLGNLAAWAFAFCVTAPLSLLASYFGGKLGSRMGSAAQ